MCGGGDSFDYDKLSFGFAECLQEYKTNNSLIHLPLLSVLISLDSKFVSSCV